MLERVTRTDLEAYLDCAICKAAKSKEQPHRSLGGSFDGKPMEHFAVDNKIIPKPASYGHITVITVIVCLVTRRGFLYPLRAKSEEIDALDRHRQAVLSRGFQWRTLKHDRAGEQTSHEVDAWCVQYGIAPHPTTTGSSEQNGEVERKIGVIQPMARALKLQGKFPDAAFAELCRRPTSFRIACPPCLTTGRRNTRSQKDAAFHLRGCVVATLSCIHPVGSKHSKSPRVVVS
jgi:hypothetical protein